MQMMRERRDERVNNYNFFNMLSMSKSLFGSLLKLFAITSSLTGGKYARRKKSACFLFVTRAFVLIGISTTTKVSLVFFLGPLGLYFETGRKTCLLNLGAWFSD